MANGSISISSTSVYIGEQVVITPNFLELENRFSLEYKFVGTSTVTGTIASARSSAYTWTTPTALLEFCSGEGGTCVITATFYNGSTVTGTSTAQLMLKGYNKSPVTAKVVNGSSTADITSAGIDMGKTVRFAISKYGVLTSVTLRYKFTGTATAQNTIVAGTTGTSYDWVAQHNLATLPSTNYSSFGNYCTDRASGNCVITVESNINSTKVREDTITIKLNAPTSWIPTVSGITASEMATVVLNSGLNLYLQGQSRVRLTANGASGSNGSTVAAYTFTFDGTSYTTSGAANNAVTTNTLKSTGSLTYKVKVTDTRGRNSSEVSGTLTGYAYAKPTITTAFTAERCNNGGTAYQSDGTKIRVTFGASYSRLVVSGANKNSLTTCQVAYATSGTYTGDTKTFTINTSATSTTGTATASNTVLNSTYQNTQKYTLRLTIQDKLYAVTAFVTIPSQKVTLDFKENGLGLGIGGMSQNDNTIDSSWVYKGTSIELSERVTANGDNERWPIVQKDSTGANNRVQMGVGSTNNALWLRQWASSSVYENYALPTPSATSSAWYSILTSKDAVTVAQGGTGATDAATARTNLGAAASSHDHDGTYLKLTGGTLTGDLNGTSIKLSGGLREWTDSEIASVYVLNAAGSYSRGTVINSTANRWYFRSWSPNTSYWEQFQLPNPTATSSTTGTTYSILTTKAAVTVGQGGTGATSEAAARTNLGVNGKEWNASNLGSFNTTAVNITLPQAGSWLIITGHNSTASLNSVFLVRTSGNRVWGIASAGTTSGGSTSYTWCGTVGLTASGTTITGITQGGGVNVYGIYLGTI